MIHQAIGGMTIKAAELAEGIANGTIKPPDDWGVPATDWVDAVQEAQSVARDRVAKRCIPLNIMPVHNWATNER